MDLKEKAATIAIVMAVAVTAHAGAPTGYYDVLEGKSGVTLKKAVKSAAKSHKAIAYGDDTWEVFLESDTHMVGGQRCWWDMYSNNVVAAPNSGAHGGLNIEHSVANSWWGGAKNDAYKDLMHLNPSNSDANNRKSNYPLGYVSKQTWSNGVTIVGNPKSGTCGGAKYVYEPADEYKGDFARAFFYMFTIYEDIAWMNQSDRNYMYDVTSDLLLRPWAYELLLEWDKLDPVSQKEIDRNEVIYKHQKNRNPFIDCPGLADYIWGNKKNTPFHLDGSVEPGPDPDEPDPSDPVNPDPSPTPAGYWYAVNSTSDLMDGARYVLVSIDNNVAMSYDLGSSGKFFQVCGKTPGIDKSVTPARISTVPDDVAVLTLAKSGAGWTAAVGTLKGEGKGYLKSTENKELTLTGSPSEPGTVVTINPTSSHTELAYTYSGKTSYVYYNPSAPRFTTYNSTGQEAVRLYRHVEDNPTTGLDATGVIETADELIYGIYDINGRKMAAESLDGLESGLYIIVSNFGTKKVLK